MRQKTSRKLIFAIGLVLLFALIMCAPSVCYAQLPPSYVENVQDAGLEWWSDMLALDDVKNIVDDWFSRGRTMYDFSTLDDDPIVVAVIDSGMDVEHELFSGTYGKAGDNGIYDADVLYRKNDGTLIAKNTVADNFNVADVATGGHGTHVAGIVATLIHFLGLEKYIKIMPIMAGRSSGNGAEFNVNDVIEGINFALDNGADVINLSIEADDSNFNFVSPEWANKAIFVAAAGNGKKVGSVRQGIDSATKKIYPAADEQVIGVMNISNERDADGNLQLSASSNYGDVYDLCAPGTEIVSASIEKKEPYIAKSGTSMATPVVSFASALALLKFRAIEAATQIKKSVDEVREIVEFSSTTYIQKGKYQLGVLDLKKLVMSDTSVLARVDIEAGLEMQRLGSIQEIPFKLSVLPEELQGQGSVKWSVDDPDGESIGEGFEFVYSPKETVGKQTIYARWTVSTDEGEKSVVASHTVTIEYARLTLSVIEQLKLGMIVEDKFVQSVAFEEGKTYVISFEGADNYDPDLTENFKWTVNGELVATGKEFLFSPTRAGTYEISLGVNSRRSPVSVITFTDKAGPSAKQIIEYVSYAVVAAVFVAVAVLILVRISASKRDTQQK